ncbi:hypothetical protein J4G43_026245 [Bradyrhizobium barranii subsp. barranii]|uniref:Uncharacterized protein n=1 Tax=Bradyrhizobium barranii subsp. barranii TaxID=2823807 RepID=A0A9X9XKX0_9BRAD|nr:hypothetical protein [Bradyrhizobium barranii]UEM08314.1 hypothetical protein J4G43_026245 [Bradyrhizobium barranii subsp. barranii]
MLQAASFPSAERPTTLSQFFYTHRRLTDLARGPIPSQIVEEMTRTARGIAERILKAPAANWRELSEKAILLLNELPREPEWLDSIHESLREDGARLSLAESVDGRTFNTLKEAEDRLSDMGFSLVPDSCDWRNGAGDDAGCYAVEGGGYSVKIGAAESAARVYRGAGAFAQAAE